MKTRIKFLIFAFFVIVFSSFTPNSYALFCAPSPLGESYEMAEYVFHGKLLNTNYLIFDHNPIATFEVLESFKGENTDRLSMYIDEFWSWDFVDGFEYIIFAHRDNSSLVDPLCGPKFYALPTSIKLVKQLTIPNSFIHDKYPSYITDSFTQTELDQINEFVDIADQKSITSNFYERHFHTIRDILVILSFVIGGTIIFIYFMRKKRNAV